MKNNLLIVFCLLLVAGLTVNSQTTDILIEKGKLSLFRNNFQSAIKFFEQAISKDSNSFEAYYYRGLAYLYSKEFHKAVDDFTSTILLKSDFPDAYNSRGLAYSYLNQIELALYDFSRAIELDPKFAEAYMNRGSYYLAVENFELARKDLENAAKYTTSNPELFFLLGKLEYATHNYQKSIDYFSKSLSLGLKDEKVYFNRGNAYVKLNQFQKAIDDYSKVLEINPEDLFSYNNRAFCYDKLGMVNQAEADKQKAQRIREKIYPKPVFGDMKAVSDPDSVVSFMLPDNWYYWFVKDSTKINILISKDYFDPYSEVLNIGANGAFIYNLSNDISNRSDDNIVEFWEAAKSQVAEKFEIYEFKYKKSMRYKGTQAFENLSRVQYKNTHKIFNMLEFAMIQNEKIFFINFQAPEDEFFLYEEMFQKIKNSIDINFNKEVSK